MQVVEIRVAALKLGGIMSGMREFLDRHRADPVRFETTGDGPGTILNTG